MLILRYRRFLADVRLETGEEITAHMSNTGRMPGLTRAGQPNLVKPKGSK